MQFKRSNDRYLAGVCGGIAETFGVKPAYVRVTWAVLSLISMVIPGLVVYLILYFVMLPPDE